MSNQKMREALQAAYEAHQDDFDQPWLSLAAEALAAPADAVADAAIAADRAARAEPIAWATPAGIAAIHAARLGRADNVQVPLSTYPGGDHSVAVYIAPPAAPVVTTEEGRHCGDPDCVPCRDPAEPAGEQVGLTDAELHDAWSKALSGRTFVNQDQWFLTGLRAMLAAHEAKRASCSQTAKTSTHEVGRVNETGKSEHVGGAA